MTMELRALTVDDAREVHRICAHAEVARTLDESPSDGLDGWKKLITELPLERSSFIGVFEDAALRGVAMLDSQLRARRRHIAKVWVAVDPAAWGRGIGKQLLGALCDGADRWWGFVRLELGVHADHAPGVRLCESLGFELEVRKRAAVLRDGVLVDGVHMARLRPGYAAPRELVPAAEIRARGLRLEPSAIKIRPHRPDDAEAMARTQGTDSVMEGTFGTPFQSEREWRSRLSSRDGSVRGLVALVGGRVAASAAIFAHQSPRHAHTMGFGITVDQDFQGRGVGDALTKACLELADRSGARRVELEVYADNTRAQALYRKHGFEPEGVERASAFRRGTYADAVVMGRIERSSLASST